MTVAYLAAGSNLGCRRCNLESAIRLLNNRKDISISDLSSLYETEPVGMANQPWFLNMVLRLQVETGINPQRLLHRLQQIESSLGRTRTIKDGPRIIDLDLLLVDSLVVCSKELTLPHPGLHRRKFVLLPLVELDSSLVHPKSELPLKQLIRDLDSDKRVIRLAR